MATLTKTAFDAQYTDNTSGVFKDNSTQNITAETLRDFAQDISDSLTYSGGLNWVVIQIGDWDMDANATVSVPHGIADFKKIRSVSGIIRNDADTIYYAIGSCDTSGAVEPTLFFTDSGGITSTNIIIGRDGNTFNSTDFNSTSYNRGWITIGYVN